MKIHKFYLNDTYIMLDINSGAVHVIDKMVYDIMDIFDGTNDEAVITALASLYQREELREALDELHGLIDNGQLFAPDISVPVTFSDKPLIKSLCLHIAHDCNLRCQYCFAGTGPFGQDRSLMSKEVGEKAVDFIIANSGHRRHCEVDFFGGEPLMNMPVVKHITQYIRKREAETGKIFQLTLTTNATMLTDEIIEFVTKENMQLVLSIDGRRQVHDKMRPYPDGSGSFNYAANNALRAVRARNGQNYYVRGTFTACNLDFVQDVLELAELGFTQLSVEPVISKDTSYALTEKHLPEIFDQYEQLAKIYLERKLNGTGFEFFHFNLDINNGPCVAKRLIGCGAGHEYFAVTPDGDLYPCHQFVGREKYYIGNVFDGIKNVELTKQFRQSHVLNKVECKNCWARFHCSGGCHANAELFNETIHRPYALGCELQKKRLECALMIQAKLALAQRCD